MQKEKKHTGNMRIGNKNILILVLTLFSILSCKKGRGNTVLGDKIQKTDTIYKKEVVGSYQLKFPDTVLINDISVGEINYSSVLDTIKLSPKDKRYIFFYVTTGKKLFNLDSLKKVSLDTFVSLESNIIPFKIKFTQKGNNYINGFIEDEAYIANFYNDGKTRVITHQINVTKKVYVKDDFNR